MIYNSNGIKKPVKISKNDILEFVGDRLKPLQIDTKLCVSIEYITEENLEKVEYEYFYVCITANNVTFVDVATYIEANIKNYCKNTGKILKHITVIREY